MRLAISSWAYGKEWEYISEYTFSTFKRYAKEVGAEFVPLPPERRLKGYHIHFEKMAVGKLLDEYDRVMWIDADAIIRTGTPSIFEIVPEDTFGAFDEGLAFIDREFELDRGARHYGLTLRPPKERPFKYFNAGVMVFSRVHAEAFQLPEKPLKVGWPEQTHMNLFALKSGWKFKNITKLFNGFSLHNRKKEERDKLHIIHYAGWNRAINWCYAMVDKMREDYR